ncbi:MAG: sigma-54 dependent transcriptional regulator [Rhodothermia bacterium]|nr:sigma-54 dependent transcriptional regulator [Rhodothermia bacterium]NNL46958.1 sigma-54-dependent Fis family transcriptional regulator [Acidimicrobiia bacterium]
MDRDSIQERFGIIGKSAALRHVIDQIRLVARTDVGVLIQGESGVGKELVAHAIHEMSQRRHGQMIIVNCGAIPEGLLESELFGTEKGAYTGAVERRAGYFEEADKSSIFLDEIGEMPQNAQVRLLRVLESGEFSRVGSAVARKTDARVIAATNKDLSREVEAGRFREDLYYRLSTVIINIPPLRQRPDDILPLFDQFLHRYTQEYDSSPRNLTSDARELLGRYRWPGNVRELRNVAERMVVLLRKNEVTAEDIRPHLRGVSASGASGGLVKVERDDFSDEDGDRSMGLVYRALVELRMEIRELKEQINQLAGGGSLHLLPRKLLKRGDSDLVVVKADDQEQFESFIEEVPYEIAADEDAPAGDGQPKDAPAPLIEEDKPLPTLEDAERRLINEALKRFDGNRRQTARALGISERTLYRKLKEEEEAGDGSD